MTSNPLHIADRSYRKDIDGLRAVSVLLVVLFHLRVAFVASGFIGVDVFFVISGFLITSHIYQQTSTGHFSLKHFYLKRMRRILPALVVMLFFSTVVALFLLLPVNLKNYSHSLLAALSYVSNFYFWQFIHIGYFSTDASKLPLLHTWSLGVEEQFYIFWPVIVILMTMLFSSRRIVYPTLLLAASSFVFYFFFRSHSQMVFYSPIARAFELLMGALLALKRDQISLNSKLNHVLSLVGLAAIIYAGCFLMPSSYPGCAVLLPTVGAVLLLLTGRQQGIANRLLSFPPLVFIGLISYSLYLWHWPIIAYLNYFGVRLTWVWVLAVLFISIILSTLSWRLIELPFRFKFKFNFSRTLLFFWIVPLLLGGLFVLLLAINPTIGFNRIERHAEADIANQYFGRLKPSWHCHNSRSHPARLGAKQLCVVGDLSAKTPQVLITGDSHAMADTGMLSVLLKQAGLKAYVATQASTPFVLVKLPPSESIAKNLLYRDPVIKRLIETHHFHYVVLGGDWGGVNYHFIDHIRTLKTGLENTINFILKNNAAPVLILDYPPLFSVPVTCGITRFSLSACYNSKRRVEDRQGKLRNMIISLKKKYPSLILIDPSKVICKRGKCYSILNGVPLYFTGKLSSHLNYAGSVLVGKRYLKQYGNPFQSADE